MPVLFVLPGICAAVLSAAVSFSFAVYPRQTPVSEDVDFEFLAGQFELSGSSIKNIAVSAAFRAAAAGTEVEMEQILNCLKEEMKKSGKNLQREDFGPYYSLMNREEDTSHAII